MNNDSQSELRRYCERLAKLEDEKAEIAAEIKQIKTDAQYDGFDAALIAKTVKLMRMEGEKRKKALDQHDLFDTYLHAAGLIQETPAS